MLRMSLCASFIYLSLSFTSTLVSAQVPKGDPIRLPVDPVSNCDEIAVSLLPTWWCHGCGAGGYTFSGIRIESVPEGDVKVTIIEMSGAEDNILFSDTVSSGDYISLSTTKIIWNACKSTSGREEISIRAMYVPESCCLGGGAPASPSTGTYPSLGGEWICRENCPAGGEGNVAKIVHTASGLVFINEAGVPSDGHFEDASTVVVPSLGVRGALEDGGRTIRWSNGTVWVRGAEMAVLYPDLSGRWICSKNCPAGGEGKPTRIEQNGRELIFINEAGQSSSGTFEDIDTVIVPGINVRGTLRDRARAIHWSNGSVWVR